MEHFDNPAREKGLTNTRIWCIIVHELRGGAEIPTGGKVREEPVRFMRPRSRSGVIPEPTVKVGMQEAFGNK